MANKIKIGDKIRIIEMNGEVQHTDFEECKKIMRQYLDAKKAMEELKKRCATCKENICHCNEGCPMMIDGQCRFGE